ncbi:MAG: hypothetical protein LLF97_11635 [Planctomycetaceae bacterium]|nr:hypothetical protein [Planctomycetaceae bacterium]
MALLLVLLLLSLALGLSYAAMRSAQTGGMIQRNADRRAQARQAAVTGLTIALKKMQQNGWSGVDSTLSGTLSSTESFSVTYTTGDPRLDASSADQPYRVTLISTGQAFDPTNASSVAKYKIRAVVQLIPRKLVDEPSDWDAMVAQTVYQWTSGSFYMDLPARIEGPVRIQATCLIGWTYSWWGDPRNQYLQDLGAMCSAGQGDYRGLSGTVSLATAWQVYDTTTLLSSYWNLPLKNLSNRTVTSFSSPSSVSTYRLYPGGKSYTIKTLPSSITSAVYRADPATNPAGLFVRPGGLTIGANTTIAGTVITTSGGRITISGQNVTMSPVNLPALYGSSSSVQLPVAVVGGDFRVNGGAGASVTGLVAVHDTYDIESSDDTATTLTHRGKLIAGSVVFEGRNNWNSKTATWWQSQYNLFAAQKNYPTGIKYFPVWLAKKQSLDYIPRLTIAPDGNSIRYHWHNPQNTIYEALASDGGLRWNLLEWKENL